MRHIYTNGIHIMTGFKLLPSGYSAITLFGWVFMRKNYEEAIAYLNTNRGQLTISHEKIHILQKKSTKLWAIFYILYIWYFLKLYLCTFKWRLSYRTIPFEMEAFDRQYEVVEKSEWKHYIFSNKERKEKY